MQRLRTFLSSPVNGDLAEEPATPSVAPRRPPRPAHMRVTEDETPTPSDDTDAAAAAATSGVEAASTATARDLAAEQRRTMEVADGESLPGPSPLSALAGSSASPAGSGGTRLALDDPSFDVNAAAEGTFDAPSAAVQQAMAADDAVRAEAKETEAAAAAAIEAEEAAAAEKAALALQRVARGRSGREELAAQKAAAAKLQAQWVGAQARKDVKARIESGELVPISENSHRNRSHMLIRLAAQQIASSLDYSPVRTAEMAMATNGQVDALAKEAMAERATMENSAARLQAIQRGRTTRTSREIQTAQASDSSRIAETDAELAAQEAAMREQLAELSARRLGLVYPRPIEIPQLIGELPGGMWGSRATAAELVDTVANFDTSLMMAASQHMGAVAPYSPQQQSPLRDAATSFTPAPAPHQESPASSSLSNLASPSRFGERLHAQISEVQDVLEGRTPSRPYTPGAPHIPEQSQSQQREDVLLAEPRAVELALTQQQSGASTAFTPSSADGGATTASSFATPSESSSSFGLESVLQIGAAPRSVDRVIEVLRTFADRDGAISLRSFQMGLLLAARQGLLVHEKAPTWSMPSSANDEQQMFAAAAQLFALFTSPQRDDVAPFAALVTGLAVIGSQGHVAAVRAAFDLFDGDNDGWLTDSEMQTYLASVFRVVLETDPEARAQLGLPHDSLARSTTDQCFADLGISPETGKIRFEQFEAWFEADGGADPDAMVAQMYDIPEPPMVRDARKEVEAREQTEAAQAAAQQQQQQFQTHGQSQPNDYYDQYVPADRYGAPNPRSAGSLPRPSPPPMQPASEELPTYLDYESVLNGGSSEGTSDDFYLAMRRSAAAAVTAEQEARERASAATAAAERAAAAAVIVKQQEEDFVQQLVDKEAQRRYEMGAYEMGQAIDEELQQAQAQAQAQADAESSQSMGGNVGAVGQYLDSLNGGDGSDTKIEGSEYATFGGSSSPFEAAKSAEEREIEAAAMALEKGGETSNHGDSDYWQSQLDYWTRAAVQARQRRSGNDADDGLDEQPPGVTMGRSAGAQQTPLPPTTPFGAGAADESMASPFFASEVPRRGGLGGGADSGRREWLGAMMDSYEDEDSIPPGLETMPGASLAAGVSEYGETSQQSSPQRSQVHINRSGSIFIGRGQGQGQDLGAEAADARVSPIRAERSAAGAVNTVRVAGAGTTQVNGTYRRLLVAQSSISMSSSVPPTPRDIFHNEFGATLHQAQAKSKSGGVAVVWTLYLERARVLYMAAAMPEAPNNPPTRGWKVRTKAGAVGPPPTVVLL